MKNQKIHLVCNAHIDPVWLWEWEEGAAAAISTFRTAADLCEEFDSFIFNHNEAVIYKWVEEYEPVLFKRIQKLVKQKKWNIIGGWYLQPDCNMPSGESLVRQCITGKTYFKEKFGVDVKTAVNFDSFGHTRGLVQIMAKAGFNFYMFCRPAPEQISLPADDFIWTGYDGSQIICRRATEYYNSTLGKARQKIEEWIKINTDKKCGMILWGVGNHGGGASRLDLREIKKLINANKERIIIHSTPEAYLQDLKKSETEIPEFKEELRPHAVGCYTSIIRIKQKHRKLENDIFAVEKMAAAASFWGLMKYPSEEINSALQDLMLSEFHDALPGSHIQPVEEATLRSLDHGLEITSRVKARTFFALAAGQPKAKDGEIPILVYNHHPYKVDTIIECEFQLADPNWENVFSDIKVYKGKKALPSQVEKEASCLPIDWRKKVVFRAELEPGMMNRFDCKIIMLPAKPVPSLKKKNGKYIFKTKDLCVEINISTGLIDRYTAGGIDLTTGNAFQPIVIEDDEDPWHMRTNRIDGYSQPFALMNKKNGSEFSGLPDQTLESVRVIEDGDVHTVVEAVLTFNNSFICQRYKLPKQGSEIEVDVKVFWNEKDKMLKLRIPTLLKDSEYIGQSAYGFSPLPLNGDEAVSQKWNAVISKKSDRIFYAINDGIYGSSFRDGVLSLNLLRSPGYAAHPMGERTILPQDRFTARIDQGERNFRFWFNGGKLKEKFNDIDRIALSKNERPFALSFFPCGDGKKPGQFITLSDKAVILSAMKKSEKGNDIIIRLFEPTGKKRETILNIPSIGIKEKIIIQPFEIKTLRINPHTKKCVETDLMELKI